MADEEKKDEDKEKDNKDENFTIDGLVGKKVLEVHHNEKTNTLTCMCERENHRSGSYEPIKWFFIGKFSTLDDQIATKLMGKGSLKDMISLCASALERIAKERSISKSELLMRFLLDLEQEFRDNKDQADEEEEER